MIRPNLLAWQWSEGRGHARERETPAPFDGPLDFASRFVLTGAWRRNFRAARPR